MTQQEIFDKVVDHFLSENYVFHDANKAPTRLKNGLVSCLIPPEKYDMEMEHEVINLSFILLMGLFELQEHKTLIDDLMSCERCDSISETCSNLIRLANIMELKIDDRLINFNLL